MKNSVKDAKVLAHEDKTNAQLIAELADLRRRLSVLQGAADCKAAVPQEHARLLEAKELLSDVLYNSPDMIAAVDDRFTYIALNEAYAREFQAIFGLDVHEGDNMADLLSSQPADRQASLQLFGRALQGESVWVTEALGDPGKASRIYELRINPLRTEGGRILGAIQIGREVTERKQAEEALLQRERRYRTLFDSMEAFCLLEPVLGADGYPVDFRYLEINDAGARLRGLPADAIVGRTILEVLPNIDPYWIQAYGKVYLTGTPIQFERQNQRNRLWYRTYAYSPEKGQVASLIIDVTAIKKAEQSLQELTRTLEEKVAERTELAEARAKQLQALAVELIEAEEQERERIAGLLHEDLQQLLAAARFTLQAKKRLDPEIREVQRLLEEAIRKSRNLSHELSPPVLHQSGLKAALEWLCAHLREQFGLVTELETGMDRPVESEPSKVFIFRAVRELLFNIVKHAGVAGARVRLESSDNELMITVSDSGVGFDPSIIEKYAPKAGLGLRSLRERASYIGGKLAVESAPGRGSRFILRVPALIEKAALPVKDETAEKKAPAYAAPAEKSVAEAGLRVLFADDHKVMRQGLIRLVSGKPHIAVVGEAADGKKALELARLLRPDVVVMDVSMPVMDGVEATRRIKAELPEIRVIALSMHADEHVSEAMFKAGAEAYLSKTASSAELLNAIYGSWNSQQNDGAAEAGRKQLSLPFRAC